MTEAVQIALVASIAPTIVATGGAILVLRKQTKVVEVTKEASHKAEIAASEAKTIAEVTHTLVNSRLTEEIKAKEAALARVKALEVEIARRYEPREEKP